MATPRRRAGASVKRRLLEKSHRFDFFQAMRLLEKIARQEAESQAEARPAGYDGPADREAVRLRVLCSRNFPAGEVYSIVDRKREPGKQTGQGKQTGPRDARFAMIVAFMGLFGPNGVMPLHYTQTILDRVRRKDYALRDFLDLFHHRIISMFYRAWEKYRFPIALERARADRGKNPKRDDFTQSLVSMIGLGTGGLENRLEIDDDTLIYFAGHFAHQPRSALGLQQILEAYFSFPVRVRQFAGHWLYLDPPEQSRLPDRSGGFAANNLLGEEVVLGHRVWNIESRFRLEIGPVDYKQYLRLMPSGDQLVPLAQLTRRYIGTSLDFDIRVVLKKSEVPPCILGREDQPAMLGYNMWLRVGDLDHDPDDAVLQHQGYPIPPGTDRAAAMSVEYEQA
ncbi:MAG: type VI secretion system baseplate subunit TssG [Pirellulaceae bacterium]